MPDFHANEQDARYLGGVTSYCCISHAFDVYISEQVFLNLHGHSYVRLDGSTAVEKRQKLMDRFNTDPKLFCFVLSTRSGTCCTFTMMKKLITNRRAWHQSHRCRLCNFLRLRLESCECLLLVLTP
jgi:hypothetical protein